MEEKNDTIWTIGHSTRSAEEFLAALKSFEIEMLVDVRRYLGSRKYPHFNVSALETYLPEAGIDYLQEERLGGRRKPKPDTTNTVWRNEAFRGYADYMETDAFKEGIRKLEEIATRQRTAYMCSEAVWWRCHRSMISDYLKVGGWKVMHIMDVDKESEHPYTAPARVMNSELSYASGETLKS
jgi:uncharacterized protein (DUF488 family)